MKAKYLIALLGFALLLVSCEKEAPPPEAPLPQTEANKINWGRCPDCQFIGCTDRFHDRCLECGVSLRPPAGCICISPGGGDSGYEPPEVPIGTLKAEPNPVVVTPGQTVRATVLMRDSFAWVTYQLDPSDFPVVGEAQGYVTTAPALHGFTVTVKPGVTITRELHGVVQYREWSGFRGDFPIVVKPN